MKWIVVTGGGGGIGRGLVQHFSSAFMVLTCGRRMQQLEETRSGSSNPENVVVVEADITNEDDRTRLRRSLPTGAEVALLVQNAAIGDPAPLSSVSPAHLEEALRVNVVAPLALTQAFLPALRAGRGRILHMGTSVAHRPQEGTLTYGLTKKAFHRLYEQINAEADLGVPCGSVSPGMVDTEGVQDHVRKARALDLPHVRYFDEAFSKGWLTPMDSLASFVEHLLSLDAEQFSSKEWKYSEWAQTRSTDPNPGSFGAEK